jgi:hypothetical protein
MRFVIGGTFLGSTRPLTNESLLLTIDLRKRLPRNGDTSLAAELGR